ncbi:MAG: Rpn family recombination-promoting nuclease/putative transposase [Micrococcales bacterium]|nr:Rpn family recombination-promoting nuclease/putative transposase [Micrococcales bacterium]
MRSSPHHDDEPKVLPLYYDAAFRWVFGTTHHKDVLRQFLSTALPELPTTEWAALALPSPHLLGPGQKEAVVDLHVTTAELRSVIVELQAAPFPAMRERLKFYEAKQTCAQLAPGAPYDQLRPVLMVAVCGFCLFDDEPYRHTFHDYDVDNGVYFQALPNRRTLELPKLGADDGTDLWDWLRLISAKDEEEIEMAVDANPDLRQAADLVAEFSADPARRDQALTHERYLRAQATYESHGRKQGLEEGIQQGLQQGAAAERMRRIRRALSQGMPPAQVASLFEITPDDVAAVLDEA